MLEPSLRARPLKGTRVELRQMVERIRAADEEPRGLLEVWLCTPGLHALAAHRLGAFFWDRGWRTLPKLLALWMRSWTGIWVHPAARLGQGCYLAGAGIAIGQAVRLGEGCVIGPEVTLGSGFVGPFLGNRVLVEAGARLLGEHTIGDRAHIGPNAVVTREIPGGALALGNPARLARPEEQGRDAEAGALRALADRLYHVEERLQGLAFAQRMARRQQGSADPLDRVTDPGEYGMIPEVERFLAGTQLSPPAPTPLPPEPPAAPGFYIEGFEEGE